MRFVPLVTVCVLLSVTSTAAQAADSVPLPRVFLGAGVGPSTNDAASRMRLFEKGVAAVWLLEAGAAASERIGIGVEYSRPSTATAFTTIGAGRAQIAGRQQEQQLLAMVRARLIGVNRWAADMVGGAGILFQHHESGQCVPARTRCENTDGFSLDHRAPAFAAGLDIPVKVASHFEMVVDARAYFLRRGEHTSASDINLSWQYEWQSSTRATVGVIGRVVW
jgi:hypothetical protein